MFWFAVPVLNPSGQGHTTARIPMVLPHDVLFLLYHMTSGMFEQVMGTSGVLRFWQLFGSGADNHPHFDGNRASYIIPLRIWGDDSAHSNVDSFECITFTSSVHFGVNHWFCKLLSAMLSLKNAIKQTHQVVYEQLVWSLGICASGLMPPVDMNGASWSARGLPGDEWRESVAGADMAGPWTALFWEISGDLKWEADSLELPMNYRKNRCCPFCPALAIEATTPATAHLSCLNFDVEGVLFLEASQTTQADLLAAYAAAGVPVTAFVGAPGFDIQRSLLLDFQHANALGLLHRSNANSLVKLAGAGYFGDATGDFETVLNIKMRRAYGLFRTWRKANNLAGINPSCLDSTISFEHGFRETPYQNSRVFT